MRRWLLHVGLPICVGLLLGFGLRWTWIQCLTLPLSLVMFVHWVSRRTGGAAFEELDSPKVALLLTGGLLILSWLAFWHWERPYTSAYRGLEGPEPGPQPIPLLGWGHPRIISFMLALAPGSLYIAENAGRRIFALLGKTRPS